MQLHPLIGVTGFEEPLPGASAGDLATLLLAAECLAQATQKAAPVLDDTYDNKPPEPGFEPTPAAAPAPRF